MALYPSPNRQRKVTSLAPAYATELRRHVTGAGATVFLLYVMDTDTLPARMVAIRRFATKREALAAHAWGILYGPLDDQT
jgi:hypothetical protein